MPTFIWEPIAIWPEGWKRSDPPTKWDPFAPPRSVKAELMGVDWMTEDELGEAIPPAYTEHLGRQLLEVVR